MNYNPLEHAYSTRYAVKYLYDRGVDISDRSLQRLAQSGKLGHKRNGDNWYFTEEELDDYFIHNDPPNGWLIVSASIALVIVVIVIGFL